MPLHTLLGPPSLHSRDRRGSFEDPPGQPLQGICAGDQKAEHEEQKPTSEQEHDGMLPGAAKNRSELQVAVTSCVECMDLPQKAKTKRRVARKLEHTIRATIMVYCM